jgi:hypothetical protein
MTQDSVYILGSGASLTDFNFASLANKDVIAVNKSLFAVPTTKYFITMDYSFLTKIHTKYIDFTQHKASKFFVVNLCKPYLQELNGTIVDTRKNSIYNLKDFNVIIKSRKDNLFGFDFNDFRHGENSAYCALQLAILLNYKKIYLLGIDLVCNEKTHFHDGYKQDRKLFIDNLNKYCTYFADSLNHIQQVKPNITIYNCSAISRLKNILPYFPQENIC